MWVVFNYNPDVWNVVGIFDDEYNASQNMNDTTILFFFKENENDELKDFIWNMNIARKNIIKYIPKKKRSFRHLNPKI